MSGGAFDYLSYRVDEVADEMVDIEIIELTRDFAKLLHEAEWYQSGDIGKGDYNKAVKEFKDKWLRGSVKQEIIDKKVAELKTELTNAFGDKKFCCMCTNWRHKSAESCYGDCKYCTGVMKHSHDDACNYFEGKDN